MLIIHPLKSNQSLVHEVFVISAVKIDVGFTKAIWSFEDNEPISASQRTNTSLRQWLLAVSTYTNIDPCIYRSVDIHGVLLVVFSKHKAVTASQWQWMVQLLIRVSELL